MIAKSENCKSLVFLLNENITFKFSLFFFLFKLIILLVNHSQLIPFTKVYGPESKPFRNYSFVPSIFLIYRGESRNWFQKSKNHRRKFKTKIKSNHLYNLLSLFSN